MTAAFLSPQWFARARELTSGLPAQPGLDFRLQFEVFDKARQRQSWYEVITDGQVVTFASGRISDPHLVLRLGLEDARLLHRGHMTGTSALRAIMVSTTPDGPFTPPAPLDIGSTPGLKLLPDTPGASLDVQYHFTNGPFGPVEFYWAFVDGMSADMALDTVDDPDVTVTISYERMVRVRTGAISVLEALEDGGRVDGAVGALMLLAGLQESPELHNAELECGPSGPVLAAFARVTNTPQHRRAMAALAQATL